MKSTLLTFIFIISLQCLTAQKNDSSILIQNTKLTNVEKEDVIEINKTRKIVIQNVVVDANNHASKLFALLKSDLTKKLSDNYFDEDRLKDEVKQRIKKITVNSFLVSFIGKAKERDNINKFVESYSFLITFPFYFNYTHGYGYMTSNYLLKMEREIIIDENGNENIGKFKMYSYKMMQLN